MPSECISGVSLPSLIACRSLSGTGLVFDDCPHGRLGLLDANPDGRLGAWVAFDGVLDEI